MAGKPTIQRHFIILLAISAAARALLAALFELGNDEAYYWTYSLYPSLSYFDHPPMVAWLIRLFTFNLSINHELFVRLAAIVAGTLNTILVFSIGKKLRDELTGWYAALLYTASVYCFIISGTFILPDSPQTFFWLAALRLLLDVLPDKDTSARNRKKLLIAGVLLGLGLLSKYTTGFLWMGMCIYMLLYNRKWLSTWQFYLANVLTVVIFSPVIAWNISHSFISISYHSGRVAIAERLINADSLLTELAGELLYTNPVNLVLILSAVIAIFRGRFTSGAHDEAKLLLWTGLPLIIVFWIVALFRNTLPHWSGPGYLTLIPMAALWLRSNTEKLFPKAVVSSLAFLLLLITISVTQIKTGFIPWPAESKSITQKGEDDISLELIGWRHLRKEFKALTAKYESQGEMPARAPLISYRWFPAANLEYYAAWPTNRVVMGAGPLSSIHQYAYVNRLHGGFRLNTDAWYITSSRDYRPPESLKPLYYRQVSLPDTITVTRSGKPVYYFFVYRMKDLQSKPQDPFGKQRNE